MFANRSITLLGIACFSLLTSAAFAQSYRMQATVTGLVSEGEYDQFQEDSYRAGSVDAVVYFSAVELGRGPWEQAAFLNKSGYVGATKVKGTLEREALTQTADQNGYRFSNLDDIDVDVEEIYGRGVFANRITADFSASWREEAATDSSYENDSIGLTVGSYFKQTNWWGFTYKRMQVSHHFEESEHDVSVYGLAARHLMLQESDLGVGVEYGVSWENGREIDDAWELFSSFTFYLSQRTGVTMGASVRDGEIYDTGRIDMGVNYFIMPQVAVAVHILARQLDFPDSSIDYLEEGILFELTGRL